MQSRISSTTGSVMRHEPLNFSTPMNHPVSNDTDVRFLVIESLWAGSQQVQAFGNRRLVVEHLGNLNRRLVVSALKVNKCLCCPYLFHETFGQNSILISGDQGRVGLDELELDC